MRTLVWFRADLRVADNTALWNAARRGEVVGCFLIAPDQWRSHDYAGVRIDLMLRTLRELSGSLGALNIPLIVRRVSGDGDGPLLLEIARRAGCGALAFNREYEVDESRRDAGVALAFESRGLSVETFDDQAIVPPRAVRTGQGRPFAVYTPFLRACERWLEDPGVGELLPQPARQRAIAGIPPEWTVIPESVEGFSPHASESARLWPGGEGEASRRLASFVKRGLAVYAGARDELTRAGTSALSPYLAIGAISPRQCLAGSRSAGPSAGAECWIRELLWRDFYIHVLEGFPRVCMGRAFKPATDAIPWRDDPAGFDAWRHGRTGFPIVDAGMRQLLREGWMHNRARMITAMFLAKDLLVDWRQGERHFIRHLVDGFFASNNGGWQWSASTGTDAAPYFRIFNPVSQSRERDPRGEYIRRYVPELASLDDDEIHDPPPIARAALGYPVPIVDHAMARDRAIAAFKGLRGDAPSSGTLLA